MSKKPHVVIIMADQLRYDMLGEDTPNISEIAKEGISFNRAYCASPLCVPARGAFFTGTYPNVNGSIINPWLDLDAAHGNVRCGIPNLYSLMEDKWDSWHSGKQHLYTEEGNMEHDSNSKTNWLNTHKEYSQLLHENGVKRPGGETFRGRVAEMGLGKYTQSRLYSIPSTGCYEEGFDNFFDGYFAKGAVKAIQKRDKDKPFLLNAMFLAPHPPLDIPEPWYSMFEDIELPENVGKWCDDQSPLQMYNLTGILGTKYNREEWREIWRVYKGLVALLDYCVGMIIDELKNEGIYDDTLIIFTSDHGEMLGSHCLWQKMCMYEESSRIPLYIKFPGDYIPEIKESNQLVSAVDVLPTLCEFLEIEKPEVLSGVSLMPVVKGRELERDDIYIQFDGNGARGNFQRCIVKGDYKLIADIFKDEIYLELYNVIEDSQELENLVFNSQYSVLIEEMLASLRNHMEQTKDMLKIPENVYQLFIANYSQFRR